MSKEERSYSEQNNNIIISTNTPEKELLRLNIEDGKLKVVYEEGVLDAAAKIFFENTLKPVCDNYIKTELRKVKMTREEIETALGKKMHEIGIQQNICITENTKLKALQDEANKLDVELSKLDGKRD